METKKLNPNQIVTLNDFPIYDKQALKNYFEAYKTNNETKK